MIETFSIFYYGIKITSANQYINFNEGSGELAALINIGSYTHTEFLTEIRSAMNNVGSNLYDVTLDRETRKITISADGTFDLLLGTGSQKGTSAFSLMGFTTGSDLTGLTSYEGDSGSGFEYEPQMQLQEYKGNEYNKEKVQSNVNESGSGELEIVTFGEKSTLEFSLKYINDLYFVPGRLKGNPNAVAEAISFLNDLIERGPLEIMKDINNRSSYEKIVLEKTPSSDIGVGYVLEEVEDLKDYYEIGPLVFRVF